MTYEQMLAIIAHKWDNSNKNAEDADRAQAEIYGMISCLANVNLKLVYEVRNDVIKYGHKHGLLLDEQTVEF